MRLPANTIDELTRAGWRPVPDHAAANPEQRPRNAVGLHQRHGRLACLVATPEGYRLGTGRV